MGAAGSPVATEQVIAFVSHTSPTFSKEDPQVRVELDMEPKSEPEGPRERGWGPRPELEKNGGGVLVSCLAQVGKTKIVM